MTPTERFKADLVLIRMAGYSYTLCDGKHAIVASPVVWKFLMDTTKVLDGNGTRLSQYESRIVPLDNLPPNYARAFAKHFGG